jgi:hypothetical protein
MTLIIVITLVLIGLVALLDWRQGRTAVNRQR